MDLGSVTYALNTGIAGAMDGLNKGMDKNENKRRFELADKRATESHDLAMQQGHNLLDKQAMTLQHDHFTQKLDPALSAFLASDGLNFTPLRDAMRSAFPGAEGFDMVQDPETKNFTLHMGDGSSTPPLDAEHVAGLAAHARDPAAFAKAAIEGQAYKAKAAAAAAAKGAEFDRQQPIKERAQAKKDDRADRRAVLQGNSRIAAARAPRNLLTPADDGTYAVVSPGGATPVPGTGPATRDPHATLTFTKRAKSGGGQSKLLADIDEFSKHLDAIDGETPDQRWMRAASERAKGKDNPEAAVRAFEASLTAKVMSDPMITSDPEARRAAQQQIDDTVAAFKLKYVKNADPLVNDGDPMGLGIDQAPAAAPATRHSYTQEPRTKPY